MTAGARGAALAVHTPAQSGWSGNRTRYWLLRMHVVHGAESSLCEKEPRSMMVRMFRSVAAVAVGGMGDV